MTYTDNRDYVPIYDSLVEEHGDVVAETRQAAEQMEQAAAEVLDWSDTRVRR